LKLFRIWQSVFWCSWHALFLKIFGPFLEKSTRHFKTKQNIWHSLTVSVILWNNFRKKLWLIHMHDSQHFKRGLRRLSGYNAVLACEKFRLRCSVVAYFYYSVYLIFSSKLFIVVCDLFSLTFILIITCIYTCLWCESRV